MKNLVTIVRILVGLLFIFSGLVKANDPLGLSFKMQEFFEIWDMSRFDSWTLLFSVLMNAFEIIAGFALLFGWRIRLFTWLLLLLILFFTFLTGYTYITGKPANCGCFGDCIPITPATSFLKDLVLLIMIGFLFWQQRYIQPLFSSRTNTILMLLVTIFSFGFQWYTLNYLPVVDCLPYKKGNNINEKMKMPANAIPDSTVITFVYEKDGKTVEFTADKFPADFKTPPYIFKSRYDKVIRKGKNNEPPIKGFVLSGNTDIDSTQIILEHPSTILVFIENFSVPVSKWKDGLEKVYAVAKSKNIPVYVVTGNMLEARQQFAGTAFADIPILKCDYTAIRTAARTSPCLYLLKAGTIEGKWSHKTMDELQSVIEGIQFQPSMNQNAGKPDTTQQLPVDSQIFSQ
jgi:uncharacterized membrane protein YphA (DoxX/SURF4 family)